MSFDLHKKEKIFKINKGKKKIGIVSKTYDELRAKCSTKFFMTEEKIKFSLDDGTEVDDDYFDVLENKEELFIKDEDPYTYQLLNRLEDFLQQYKTKNENEFNERLDEVLRKKDVSQMLHSLIFLSDASLHKESSRLEDINWFRGLDTKYKSKEAVLKNSAETRMRGYFQKMKKDLEHCKNYHSYLLLTKQIQDKLKLKKYHSHYFDRSEQNPELRLCTPEGLFHCFGDFESSQCRSKHLINPYNSREERIIFSTWNLDHIIEKSRSIIPVVKKALEENPDDLIVNTDYLFELMFEHYQTLGNKRKGNLKLVHIVCHNKNPHNLSCDKKKLISESEELHKAKKIRH